MSTSLAYPVAGEAGDDDIEDGHDSIDNSHKDGADGVHDSHDAAACEGISTVS